MGNTQAGRTTRGPSGEQSHRPGGPAPVPNTRKPSDWLDGLFATLEDDETKSG